MMVYSVVATCLFIYYSSKNNSRQNDTINDNEILFWRRFHNSPLCETKW